MKLEGNLINRILETKKVDEIVVGTDITECYYSDRCCYYVTKVIDQKHIFVRKYFVAPDWSQPPMSNNWLYFKDQKEYIEYQKNNCPYMKKDCFIYNPDLDKEEEWVLRYNKWQEKLGNGKYCKHPNLAFNAKDYYYDYEF